jgi:hypothetical protein
VSIRKDLVWVREHTGVESGKLELVFKRGEKDKREKVCTRGKQELGREEERRIEQKRGEERLGEERAKERRGGE